MITLQIMGPPIPKERHRTGQGRTYNPQKEIENSIRWEIKSQLPRGFRPFTGPCQMRLVAYFTRPKGHYGTGKNAMKVKKSAPAHPAVKPDWDNAGKFYSDCMNGIVFRDDAQVVDCWVRKKYDVTPRVEIYIGEIK